MPDVLTTRLDLTGPPSGGLGKIQLETIIAASRPPSIVLEVRPLIAHGIECLWWGPIIDAHRTPQFGQADLLRCPFCGGHAVTHYTEESFLTLARRFEVIGFPHHQALIRWLKGRCYRTRREAWEAFCAEWPR